MPTGEAKMEEEYLKRNTDCVYFLASPLTCKKGGECEYRHSEIARLNSTDCWYWLSGSCLKPACPFRHPPLENHVEAQPESASVSHQSSVPVNKNKAPCYFYFNSYCYKGDSCLFIHGPDINAPSGKLVKTSSAINGEVPLDKKTSTGNETAFNGAQAQAKAKASPPAVSPKAVMDVKLHAKEPVQQLAPKNVRQRCPSLQLVVSESGDANVLQPDSVVQQEVSIHSRSNICTDLSSDEKVDDQTEPDDRLESSPGFDVLVDGESENTLSHNYEGGELAHDREQGDLYRKYLGYDFEDTEEYDYPCPDTEPRYDCEINDSFECVDDVYLFGDIRNDSGCSRDRILDSLLSRKRKCLAMEPMIQNQENMDLRDQLRRRRVINSCPFTKPSRSDDSYSLIAQTQEISRRHGMTRKLHGRLASEVMKNAMESLGDDGTFSISSGEDQCGWRRRPLSNRPRQHYKEKRLPKRQSRPSNGKPVLREKRTTQASTAFTGPKTLAQIKEEKKSADENGNGIGKHSSSRKDFEAPKLLHEMLKDKMKHDPEKATNGSGSNLKVIL